MLIEGSTSTTDSRVTTCIEQLSERYLNLKGRIEDEMKRSHENVVEHELFEIKLSDFEKWIKDIKSKLMRPVLAGSSHRYDLAARQNMLKDLVVEICNGSSKLADVIEVGEKLYPHTAPEGRESIRQKIRSLRGFYEETYDDIHKQQRSLESSFIQWTSLEDNIDKVTNTLKKIEQQMGDESPIFATLHEKRNELVNLRSTHHDLTSLVRGLDTLEEKAKSLVETDPTPAENISHLRVKHGKLSSAIRERLELCESYVNDEEKFQNALAEATQWLGSLRQRLHLSSNPTGDAHIIQNKLDRLQVNSI